MTSNWLHAYLNRSIREELCTQIQCTTCGATQFRCGVLDALSAATGQCAGERLNREAAIAIAKALAEVTPAQTGDHCLVPAVRCLLFDLYSEMRFTDVPLETLLANSWAGTILREMQDHHASITAQRRIRDEFQDPTNVQKRRAAQKQLKQEQHEKRLLSKKERDRLWRERHGEAD